DTMTRASEHGLPRRERAAPPAEALVGARQAQADRTREAILLEGDHRHVGLDGCDQHRVVQPVAARDTAGAHPLERNRLDRRAVLVGIDPHLPEEDPVGPRHGLLAEGDRLAAGVAVGELAQALLHIRWALAGWASTVV